MYPMNRFPKRYWGYFLFLAVLACFPGCAGSPAIAPDAETAAALTVLQECQDAVQTARGVGRVLIHSGNGKTTKARFAWIAERSLGLRLEVLGLWGRPIYRFVLQGNTFCLHDVGADTYFRGKSKGRVLKRLLGFSVEPQYLQSVLLGCVPVASFRRARLDESSETGDVELLLHGSWRRLIQKVHFDENGLAATRAEFFGAGGGVRYTVALDRFRTVKGIPFPETIRLFDPTGAEVFLKIATVELNSPLPAGAFRIEAPNASSGDGPPTLP